jgi:hypothetical protein
MRLLLGLVTVAAAVLLPQERDKERSGERPVWDQVKARAKVEHALRIERQGTPWNRVPWLTDPAKAAAEAKRTRRPVLVFFYLAKPVGPPAAPC